MANMLLSDAFLGVLLSLLYVGTALSAESPLHVYAQCIMMGNIPPLLTENNTLLKTTFEIIQTDQSLSSVLDCVEKQKVQLQNSSDPLKRFLGQAFDRRIVEDNLKKAKAVYVPNRDYSCLRNAMATPQEQCFLNVTMYFNRTGNTGMLLCSPEATQCVNVNRLNNNCSSADVTIIEATTAMFYGKCFMNRDNAPSTSPGPIPDGLPDSALFKCGAAIFPNSDLAMLFPPSEVTQAQIVNVTAAKEEQKKSLMLFCNRVEDYTRCLSSGLSMPQSALDRVLSGLLDRRNLEIAFRHYCSLKDLITDTFECTRNKLDVKCHGGVMDLVFLLNAEIQNVRTTEVLCNDMNNRQQCRLENQMKPCNAEYGRGMEHFYNLLKSDMCKSDHYKEPEAFLCFEDLVKKVKSLGTLETLPEMKNAMKTILTHVCSTKTTWLECLRKTRKTSENVFDKILFDFIIPENIEIVVDFVCTKVDEILQHSVCVAGYFIELAQTPNNCLRQFLEEDISKIVGNKVDNIRDNIPVLCNQITPVASCMRTPFDKCDASLGNDVTTLISMLSDSCNNPKAIPRTSGTSRAPVSATIVIILTALLLCVFY